MNGIRHEKPNLQILEVPLVPLLIFVVGYILVLPYINKKTYPERAVLKGSGVSTLLQMYIFFYSTKEKR